MIYNALYRLIWSVAGSEDGLDLGSSSQGWRRANVAAVAEEAGGPAMCSTHRTKSEANALTQEHILGPSSPPAQPEAHSAAPRRGDENGVPLPEGSRCEF